PGAGRPRPARRPVPRDELPPAGGDGSRRLGRPLQQVGGGRGGDAAARRGLRTGAAGALIRRGQPLRRPWPSPGRRAPRRDRGGGEGPPRTRRPPRPRKSSSRRGQVLESPPPAPELVAGDLVGGVEVDCLLVRVDGLPKGTADRGEILDRLPGV